MLKTVDLAETETQFLVYHRVLHSNRFQIYPGEDEVPVEKREGRVWCLATKSKVTDYRRNVSKTASFSELYK